MTFIDLDRVIPEETQEPRGEVFDWMSEKFQLMCREYRLDLGWSDPKDFESPLRTESERRYWERLHLVRGYEPYVYDPTNDGHGSKGAPSAAYWEPSLHKWMPIITIPDPPQEYQEWWTNENGITPVSLEEEPEEEYQFRLRQFEKRITDSDSARGVHRR